MGKDLLKKLFAGSCAAGLASLFLTFDGLNRLDNLPKGIDYSDPVGYFSKQDAFKFEMDAGLIGIYLSGALVISTTSLISKQRRKNQIIKREDPYVSLPYNFGKN